MTTEVQKEASPPSLWNPNAAACWSLLFTPIFGASLHAINWRALGEEGKSKRSMLWAVGCVAAMVLAYFLPPIAGNLVNLLYMLMWYFLSAKQQVNHIETRLNNSYKKKSWAKPLIIAIAISSILVVAIIEGIEEDESLQQQQENHNSSAVDKTPQHYVYAHDLYNKIATNAAAAQSEYTNEYIRVSGILNSIQGWGSGYFALIIDDGENPGRGAYCIFSSDRAANLNHLKSGAEISINGRIKNYSIISTPFGVEMQDCNVIQ